MKKSLVAGVVAMAMFSFGAQANGQGVVNFKGSVIDAPCGIASESADQTIDFGQISKAHLAAAGISVKKDLDIKLVNCSLAKPGSNPAASFKTVKVAFTGSTVGGQADELGTTGNTGTAIVVSEAGGKLVKFNGTAGDTSNLQDGDTTLRYSAWVKKATNGTLKEGDFAAVANFNLTYQ
ncbi:F7-2 fimbrial protein [Escherichia coli]|uniref:F7-2 fimbrial protein n=1 Tax=Escherichia coli TaxID=562 RepID=A0A0E3H166_ECOLX|nr:fimbrial protein [Escherichia coli]AKA87287.1 F7-2 fimbrial protein [Escherichia coli]OKT61276.1 F7-2 fimbrial protein [Escherichia coli]OKT92666.1 F7-2 fimbrial protein [Escherichia coli]OKU10013.1 F7-2 fimbrial protein [Escherichia coli]CTV85219.1 PixA protein [Escherichia coli]